MVSPNLVKHQETGKSVEINDNTKRLFQVIYRKENEKAENLDDVPRIKVSTLISRLSFFYEKIRNAVDYDEEHLLRKNAIARILRRQILIEGAVRRADSLKISNHLLTELIRASYLPNNQIPETKIKELAIMLEKYIKLKNDISFQFNYNLNLESDIKNTKVLINKKNKLIHWLITLAACEIEDNLAPDSVKQVIVKNLFDFLSKNIKLPENSPYQSDLEIQIYLSISRNFLKFDNDLLSFVLFKYYNENWLKFNSKEGLKAEDLQEIKQIAKNFEKLKTLVDQQLKHPIRKRLDKVVHAYSLYSAILLETIKKSPVEVYSRLQRSESDFTSSVRQTYNKKYKKAKKRLWRTASRSIIYIFFTKSIFVLLIEVPAIKLFHEPLNPVSLGINIAFPATLLFFVVLLTRRPGKNNIDKIIKGVKEISLVSSTHQHPIVIYNSLRRNRLRDVIFKLIYSSAFLVTIYYIIKLLTIIDFNWVSIIIFLFFLTFVSFFSVRTTAGIKELVVVDRHENIITFLIDLFYMPIILVGRWLSNKASKLNVFIFFFDFIIESPFKVLISIAEDWTKYVREQRDSLE